MNMDSELIALKDDLKTAIIDTMRSGNIREYFDIFARFNKYSLNNLFLIRSQCPGATYVCAKGEWEKMGGHVKDGARGISIFAPRGHFQYTVKTKTDEGEEKEETRTAPRRYGVVKVFDYSSIEGVTLPSRPNLVKVLEGDIEDFDKVFELLGHTTSAPIRWMTTMEMKGTSANGFYAPLGHRIHIRRGMPQAQTVKTIIHEVAHSHLHSIENCPMGITEEVEEMEAESVAYMVCKHFGLDTSDYSLGYITTWGHSLLARDERNGWKEYQRILDRVTKVTKDIIESLESAAKGRPKTKRATAKKKDRLTFVCVGKPTSTGPKKVGVIPRP